MSKNIVICLDGTWNDREDPNARTNVALLYEMCLNDGVTQLAYYDKGVGTDGWYDRKLGGVHGVGLSENVRQAYQHLVREYEEGDKVYLFGFSRGAFTARSLAGLMFRCGLSKDYSNIAEIFGSYKDKDQERMAEYKTSNFICPVALIGVWDTVGALGIPMTFLKEKSEKMFNFHDTKLNPEIEFACHAVAIDEKRESFEPTLWQENEENRDKIKQVWFSGVHSDVGGGYPERHHSDVALKWMVDNAKQRGLIIKEDFEYKYQPDLSRNIHDSAFGFFDIEFGTEEREAPVTIDSIPTVHWNVREKITSMNQYEPLALVKHIENRQTLAPYRIEEEISR